MSSSEYCTADSREPSTIPSTKDTGGSSTASHIPNQDEPRTSTTDQDGSSADSHTTDQPSNVPNTMHTGSQARPSTDHGTRLLPTLIDSIASHSPTRLFTSFPKTTRPEGGLRDVTYAELARAVDKCSWFLYEHLGSRHGYENGGGSEIVAYMGPADLRYQIVVLAGMKTGIRIFLPSPKNSTDTQLALLDQIDCTNLIITSPPVTAVGGILQSRRMEVKVLMGLEELLGGWGGGDTAEGVKRVLGTGVGTPGLDFVLQEPSTGNTTATTGADEVLPPNTSGTEGASPSTITPAYPTPATERAVFSTAATSTTAATGTDGGRPTPVFPYEKTFEEDRSRGVVLMQTSGSTSRWPKVVELKNGWFTAPDAFQTGTNSTWADLLRHRRVLIALPPFHSAGLALTLSLTIYYNIHTILPHPEVPITAETVHSFRTLPRGGGIHGCMISPSTVLEMEQSRRGLEDAENLEFIGFGGGALPDGAAEKLRERTRLVNNIGSTETAPLFSEYVEDPRYFRFDRRLGLEFREAFDGFYEMVIVRNQGLRLSQAVFTTFPELDEYHMKDLYLPHPSEPDMWSYQGRADDVIVFNNGEKLHPGAIEDAVNLHSELSAALVEGNGRFQAALLVESKTCPRSAQEEKHFVDRIWPTIREACENTAAHGKISKDLICVARADKPFLRTAKGSVRRKVMLDEYKGELDGLRQGNGSSESNGKESDNNSDTSSSYVDKVRGIITDEIGRSVGDADNLLSYGVDSLQIANITRRINKTLGESLEVRDIYEHQTIPEISDLIAKDGSSAEEVEDDSLNRMKTLVNDLRSGIVVNARPAEALPEKATVILTGSTGSLGTYILDSLLRSPHVDKIYCLNRSQNAQQRQLAKLRHCGLTTAIASTKCTWLKCDLSSPGLGILKRHYRELLDTATTVVHNAWDVNFNLPLSSFEKGHLRGVRNLINFTQCSWFGARMLFMSSVGIALGWKGNGDNDRVPEQVLDDWTAPERMGYAQSKFVAEKLLDEAAKSADPNVAIVRLGQLAGPVLQEKGMWTRQEWFPSIVDTSMMMGVVPQDLGSMSSLDWIPVDICANMIVELVENDFTQEDGASEDGPTKHTETVSDSEDGYVEVITAEHMLHRPLRYWTGMDLEESQESSKRRTEVFHLVNPRVADWSTVLPSVLEHFPSNFESVTLREWVQELELRLSEQDDSPGVSVPPDTVVSGELHGSKGDSLANGTARGETLSGGSLPSSSSHCQRTNGMGVSLEADLPATRLLSFFEGLLKSTESKNVDQALTFETRGTREKCTHLRHLQPVNGDWMHRWMRQWGYPSDVS
ncbi:MAG: putative NRPS-like protein biosynthetic cluster [Alyxoria varia]|nr:MAG: putative NRPS-like protein biosynthetic cluster [Alyxoria varia]